MDSDAKDLDENPANSAVAINGGAKYAYRCRRSEALSVSASFENVFDVPVSVCHYSAASRIPDDVAYSECVMPA